MNPDKMSSTKTAAEIAAELAYPREYDRAEWLQSAFIKGYAAGQESSRWIPVSERLPEPEVRVLVTDGTSVLETRHNGKGFKMPRPFPAGILVDVTHWQPLPEAPKH